MNKPFDGAFVATMQDVTRKLVEEAGATVGYTQSDEITLIWYSSNYKSQIFFNGKTQKMTSVLASMTTGFFNDRIKYNTGNFEMPLAFFDCRVWQVPTLAEACNVLLWREQDAVRNSISMSAQSQFSHKQLHKKSTKDMLQMLESIGVVWGNLPGKYKRGSYFMRQKVTRKFSKTELANLPEKHAARANPDLEVERTDIKELKDFSMQTTENKVGFIFKGEPRKEISQKLSFESIRQTASS
jgi:tRNA(His) 5'-end guanylyltransferase